MSLKCFCFAARAVKLGTRHPMRKVGSVVVGVVVAVLFVSFQATSSAQITGKVAFNTVSYNIGGSVSVSHSLETPSTIALPLFGNDLKQTSGFATNEFDYYTFPAEIKTTVANTAMTGASKAVGNVVFDIKAETGALRVNVDGFLSASSTSNQAIADASILGTAVAQARWQDTGRFTRLVDPHPGRMAILESTFDLSGLIGIENIGTPPFFSNSRLAASSVTMTFIAERVGGFDPLPPSGIVARGAKSTAVTVDVNEPAPSVIPVTLIVTEGELFTIDFRMEISVRGRTTNSFHLGSSGSDGNLFETSFIGAYGNTLKWGGITRVTDALTGEPIEGWSITSASGFNYANAYQESVPEPASIGLALLGLVGIVCLPTKRRHHRSEMLTFQA